MPNDTPDSASAATIVAENISDIYADHDTDDDSNAGTGDGPIGGDTTTVSAAPTEDGDANNSAVRPTRPDFAMPTPAVSSTFEVTPALLAESLTFDGDTETLPKEMVGSLERVWEDPDFVWPVTVSVIGITQVTTPRRGERHGQDVSVTIAIMGTGFTAGLPVTLRLDNAFGFSHNTIELPTADAGPTGFFGVEITLPATPRRQSAWEWSAERQLILRASQQDDGKTSRITEQAAVPPHAVWKWVR